MGERQRYARRLTEPSQVAKRYGMVENNDHVRDKVVRQGMRVSLVRGPTTKWAERPSLKTDLQVVREYDCGASRRNCRQPER